MKSSRWKPALRALVILMGIATSGCGSTWVVVPHPAGQYTATDTLYGTRDGEHVRVTFHFDTIMRVDTVLRVDTAWVGGTRTLVRVDTLLRVDTLRMIHTDVPTTVLRIDTVRVPVTQTVMRVDTVLRVDTVRVPTRTVVRVDTLMRVDTVRVPVTQTIVRTDTVMRVDTLRLMVTDTVTRTVRVPGRRMLFVPPGHYPDEGECRVWIHDIPPGQQAKAAACDALGTIPDGAFVLFGGDAWDFDYDWIGEAEAKPGTVPPVIVGLKKK